MTDRRKGSGHSTHSTHPRPVEEEVSEVAALGIGDEEVVVASRQRRGSSVGADEDSALNISDILSRDGSRSR